MSDFDYFVRNVKNRFPDEFNFEYSNFKGGQFGDLKRVEFESSSQIGGVDFWSTGWLSIHLVDINKGEELFNILLDPDEASKAAVEQFNKLLILLRL